ncbi:LbetaH domain-containing protein [Bacilliculturomica massiliensis]|uniref:acyltransferase n=1 Tax=Bacilliculturomica massiliensis TaxID=1917867 RepID=UPI00103110EF|nr:acyltransferase [Bacilliculturomica massiliensis]
MKVIAKVYEKITHKKAPYYMHYSLWTMIIKPIRKWFSVVLIPSIPFNRMRIVLYRLCGYKIGKNVFIGMRCYLDDMCPELFTVENSVTISYGCFFACHGKGQDHRPIHICEGAYLGMRCSVITSGDKNGVRIGYNSIIGASSLVLNSIPDDSVAVGIPALVRNGTNKLSIKE